ncbi:MAG: hypothetical protein BGN88_07310 [Clostridiales bacterium 43-6]|nr:MAG: hypothetical protein BGN88_07310 [Clostridiales bacterium 43-6]
MAKLFDIYGKNPGPGISKKEPEKTAFFKFFDTLKHKFWSLILINAIFFVSAVFFAALSLFVMSFFSTNKITSMFFYFLSCFPLIGLAPVMAGITRLTRDYVRGVPGFLWSDFVEAIKKNWKKSLIIGFYQFIISFLLIVSVSFYFLQATKDSVYYIPLGISYLISAIFIFSGYYLYMMVISLDLKIKEIIKNSLLFSFLCLGKNILVSIILLFINGSVFGLFLFSIVAGSQIISGISLALVMAITFGFSFLVISFVSFPAIKRFILDPYYEKHPEQTSDLMKLSQSEQAEYKEKELPEFVYHNGKMVHRSSLEEENVFEDNV